MTIKTSKLNQTFSTSTQYLNLREKYLNTLMSVCNKRLYIVTQTIQAFNCRLV